MVPAELAVRYPYRRNPQLPLANRHRSGVFRPFSDVHPMGIRNVRRRYGFRNAGCPLSQDSAMRGRGPSGDAFSLGFFIPSLTALLLFHIFFKLFVLFYSQMIIFSCVLIKFDLSFIVFELLAAKVGA